MKKNVVRWWIVFAVVLIVYHVAVFAVPFPKNGVFFLSWAFTLIALCVQIYTVRTAFYQGKGAKSKFYGFPIARIGATYLTVQMVLGLCFMAVSFAAAVPIWIPLVLYVLLLGISAVGFISADAMRDEIERQDASLKKDVSCMRALQSKASSMVQLAQDSPVRKALEKFSEDLRFSDPVSGEALGMAEADLAACVDEMQQAVIDRDWEAVSALTERAQVMLMERNRLCKLEKGTAR